MVGPICNIDSEIALIGSIIEEPNIINLCKDEKLKRSDFFYDEYGFLFEIICEMHKKKIKLDVTSVVSEVKKTGLNVQVSDITNMVLRSLPSNASYYIREIKECSRKRTFVSRLETLKSGVKEFNFDSLKFELESLIRDLEDSQHVKNLFKCASEIQRIDVDGGLETGFSEIDRLTKGLVYGSLTILTGEPSSGKSTFLNQVIAQNIMNKNRVMLYSGELTDFQALQWFMRCVANLNDLQSYTGKFGQYYDIAPRGEDLIRKWVENKLYVFGEESKASIENLILTMDYLARNKGVKLFVLDNLMTVENDNLEELEKQKTLAKQLKSFAKKYKACVILVAHPKKKNFSDKEKKTYHMHDVSGASEVVNLADYEFILTREIKNTDSQKIDETKIGILKNRITGIQGMSKVLNFDKIRKRFYTNSEELERNYKYDEQQQYSFIELNDVDEDNVPF